MKLLYKSSFATSVSEEAHQDPMMSFVSRHGLIRSIRALASLAVEVWKCCKGFHGSSQESASIV